MIEFIENFQWGDGLSKYIPVNTVWFTSIMIASYLLITFILYSIFPSAKRYKKGEKRPAYQYYVNQFSILYNFALSIYSAINFIGLTRVFYLKALNSSSRGEFFCTGDLFYGGESTFWLFVFGAAKPVEFIDTWLRILLQKDLIFLHVWHHATVPIQFLVPCITTGSDFTYIGAVTNSFVHTIMYYYYGMVSLNIRVWWKKIITILQLVQFSIGFVLLPIIITDSVYCRNTPGFWTNISMICSLYLSYFLLFIQFYIRTYSEKKKQTRAKEEKKRNE